MASLLPTELANQVATAFKGQLMTGTLRRETPTALDANGDPTATTVTTYSVEGIRDNFRKHFATVNSIPQTDVSILLIMNLIKPATEPLVDDLIFIRDQWHKVRRVLEIDPASASILLQCFVCAAPS